jgi:hypothetical protein
VLAVDDKVASKLETLGFEFPEWCIRPSNTLVRKFEEHFSLNLPADYRDFLVHHGGVVGGAITPFQEPTPCGTATWISSFFGFTSADRGDNVIDATELIDGAPDVVAIGDNLMGSMFWLKCTGRDAGYVYMHDHEGRSAWPDAVFFERFQNLSPLVKQYLEAREKGTLPKKANGYEHVYRVAESFTEFIECLERRDE